MKKISTDLSIQSELDIITANYKEIMNNLIGVKPYSKTYLIILESIRLIHQDNLLLYNLKNRLYPKVALICNTTISYVDRAIKIQSAKLLHSKPNLDFISSVSPISCNVYFKKAYTNKTVLTSSEFLSLFYDLVSFNTKSDLQKRIALLLNIFSVPSNYKGYYCLANTLEILQNNPSLNTKFTIEKLYSFVSCNIELTKPNIERSIRFAISNYKFSKADLNFCNKEYQTNFSIPKASATDSLSTKKFILLLHRILSN